MCDFIFEHRERQRKKHFCLLRCLSAFATPIKLYFRCVFKLLPYVALAFAGAVLFLLRLNRILNVNDAQLGSVGSAHHNLYTFHTIYTAQGLH